MCKYKREDFKDIKELRFTRTAKDAFFEHTRVALGIAEEDLAVAALDLIDAFSNTGAESTDSAMLVPTIPSRTGMQPMCAIHVNVSSIPAIKGGEDIVMLIIRDQADPLELVVTAVWLLSYYKHRRSQTGTNGGVRVKPHYAGNGSGYTHPPRSFNPIKFETEVFKRPTPVQTVPTPEPEPVVAPAPPAQETPAPVQPVQEEPAPAQETHQADVNYDRNYLVISRGVHKTFSLNKDVKEYIDHLMRQGTPPAEIIVFERKHLRVSISF